MNNIEKALGRIVSGVGILTASNGKEKTGMIISWFQQASFSPPLVSVALKKDRPIAEWIKESKAFVINVLHTGQKKMLAHFGRGFSPGEDAFRGLETHPSKNGIPILNEALCFLDCELKHIYSAGDHDLYIGEIIDASIGEEGQPMTHVRRSGMSY